MYEVCGMFSYTANHMIYVQISRDGDNDGCGGNGSSDDNYLNNHKAKKVDK